MHVYLRCLASGEETRIVTHHHLGLDLSDCIQHHSHYNQERRTTKQLVASHTCEVRQNRHNSQEQSASQRYAIENIVQVPACCLTRTIPRNMSALLLQCIWNVLLLPHYVRIKVCESNH